MARDLVARAAPKSRYRRLVVGFLVRRSVDPGPAVFSLRPRFLVGHRLTPVHPKSQLVSAIRTKGGELIASRPGKGSESGSSRNGEAGARKDMLLGDLLVRDTIGT